jgi:hypothetical protein
MTALTAQDIKLVGQYASQKGVALNACLAFMRVETNADTGTLVGNILKAIIRWEGHYFDKLVPSKFQASARKAGLASPKVGGIPNPASQTARYNILERGKLIDVTAAISSCSWGVGQIMGAHWKWLGFASAEDFEKTMQSGLSGQLAIMFAFMDKSGVIPHLRRLDWSAVARIWNGAGYAKNKYDTKMKQAYEDLEGAPAPAPTSAGMLRSGSSGAKVRELQGLLVRAGFSVTVDGDYGASTERAVKVFQKNNGLDIDGVAGPQTVEALQRYKTSPQEKVGQQKPLDTQEVKQGLFAGIGGTAGLETAKQQLSAAKDQLAPYTGTAIVDHLTTYLGVASAVVIVAGLAYAGYGLYKKRHTNLGVETRAA